MATTERPQREPLTPIAVERPPRAFVYARLSENRDNKSEMIPVQISDGRALAQQLGCAEVPDEDLFIDNSITAADPRVERPAYQRMLRAARDEAAAGRPVAFIIAQDQDRLVRQPAENEELIALSFETGTIVRVARGDLGGFNASSRAMSRVKAVMSIYETEQVKARTARRHRHRAENGLMHTGGRRGFGHNRDGTTNEAEAPILRTWMARLLTGTTLYQLATEARAQGLKTTSGKLFTWNAIERVIQQARMAGAREVGDQLIVTGAIEPVIDDALCRMLDTDDGEPATAIDVLLRLRSILRVERTGPKRRWRRHLLTGLVYCDAPVDGHACGTHMGVGNSTKLADGTTIYSYVCPAPTAVNGITGCGKCSIVEHRLQEVVFGHIVADLADDEGALARMLDRERQSVAGSALAEAHDARARATTAIESIAAEYDDRLIARTEYLRRRERQQRRLDDAQRVIDSAAHAASLLALVPSAEYALRVWRDPETPDEWRRSLLDLLVERIRVKRGKGGRRFDPTRVEIDWR